MERMPNSPRTRPDRAAIAVKARGQFRAVPQALDIGQQTSLYYRRMQWDGPHRLFGLNAIFPLDQKARDAINQLHRLLLGSQYLAVAHTAEQTKQVEPAACATIAASRIDRMAFCGTLLCVPRQQPYQELKRLSRQKSLMTWAFSPRA